MNPNDERRVGSTFARRQLRDDLVPALLALALVALVIAEALMAG